MSVLVIADVIRSFGFYARSLPFQCVAAQFLTAGTCISLRAFLALGACMDSAGIGSLDAGELNHLIPCPQLSTNEMMGVALR